MSVANSDNSACHTNLEATAATECNQIVSGSQQRQGVEVLRLLSPP